MHFEAQKLIVAGYNLNGIGVLMACLAGYGAISFITRLFWQRSKFKAVANGKLSLSKEEKKDADLEFPDEYLGLVFVALFIGIIFGINR